MPEQETTSLDRLVRTRGAMLLGASAGMGNHRMWSLGGALQVMGGSAALSGALFTSVAPEMQFLTFLGAWLFLQGLYYVATGVRMKNRAQVVNAPQVRLTKEADALLRLLIERLDESMPVPWRRRGKRSAAVLAPQAFQLLEEAARHYNRIQGVLAIEGAAANRTLEKVGPNVRAAADEALAELLHTAALIQQFPESAPVHLAGAQGRLEALTELATAVEAIQTHGAEEPDLVAPASRLESVLGELRSDLLARQEIAEAPAVQELRIGR